MIQSIFGGGGILDTICLGFVIILALGCIACAIIWGGCAAYDFFERYGLRKGCKEILVLPGAFVCIIGIPAAFFYGVGRLAQYIGVTTS
jgi:hypothetical protein